MRSTYGLDTDPVDDWRERSACRGEDPELFFSDARGTSGVMAIDAAKDVCRRCPVKRECLAWAVEIKAVDGVWGGMSEAERLPLLAGDTRECACGGRFVPRMGHQVRCRRCLDPAPKSVRRGIPRIPCPVCTKPVGVAWSRISRHTPPGSRVGDPACLGSSHLVESESP